MTSLYRELKKIFKQMYGTQNIFGYKSTAANRLYIFYCFIGKIYFTNKMNRWIKYLWYIIVSSEILFSYFIGLGYLLFEDHTDFIMMISVASLIGASTVSTLGFSFVSYFYSQDIEAMIQLVDDIRSSVKNRSLEIVDKGKVFNWMLGHIIGGIAIYSFIGQFDVVLFFEEKKLKNYWYYVYPFPLIQQYGTYEYFFFVNVLSILVSGLMTFEVVSSLALLLQWNIVCCDELVQIRDDFHVRTLHFENCSKEWDDDFECAMQRNIRRFQKISLLIDHLRGYVEWFGSILVPVAFFYGGVATVYFRSSQMVPLVVKIKFISCYWGAVAIAFVFYDVGQKLDNLVSAVSLAVYSTPWYRSVPIRKNVYIFLCQTQSIRNLSFFKVYGLLLSNFSRYLHGLFCCMNFLHRITSK